MHNLRLKNMSGRCKIVAVFKKTNYFLNLMLKTLMKNIMFLTFLKIKLIRIRIKKSKSLVLIFVWSYQRSDLTALLMITSHRWFRWGWWGSSTQIEALPTAKASELDPGVYPHHLTPCAVSSSSSSSSSRDKNGSQSSFI